MKILYITNLPAPYKVEYFNELGRQKVCGEKLDLTVVFERTIASNRNRAWKNNTTDKYFNEIYLNGKEFGDESALSFEIIKILRKSSYKFVIMNGYASPTEIIAIIYMQIMKIDYIIMCDGLLLKDDTVVKRKLKKRLISKAKACLSSGELTKRVLKKYYAGKIYFYPFSSVKNKEVIKEQYNKKEYKNRVGCQTGEMLLFVGQFIDRKGVRPMLETFEQNFDQNTSIYLVGDGMLKEELENYSNSRIKVLAFKTKKELEDYYKAADVFVLPTQEDIWGLVVNEAMSYGVPVVTTKNCGAGVQMIANGRNGYLSSVGDMKEFWDKTKELLSSESVFFDVVNTALDYTIEKMSEYTVRALEMECHI